MPVQVVGVNRAVVTPLGKLAPHRTQPLRQCVDSLVGRQRENGHKVDRVQVTTADLRQGEVDSGDGLAPIGPVGRRAGLEQTDGATQLPDRIRLARGQPVKAEPARYACLAGVKRNWPPSSSCSSSASARSPASRAAVTASRARSESPVSAAASA